MNKRIVFLAALLSLLISFSSPALGSPGGFNDLPDSHWAAGKIKLLAEKGWVSGYPDNTFHPDQKVSRGELAALIARAAGINNPAPAVPSFSDTAVNQWFFAPVEATKAFFLYDPSLKKGLFRPEDLATRQEAASAIALASGLSGSDPGHLQTLFSDYNSILPEYRNIIASAVEKNIIRGYPDGTFGPDAPLTRAEAAAMVCSAFLKQELDLESLLNSVSLKDLTVTPEEYRATRDELAAGLGSLDGVNMDLYIGKMPGDSSQGILVFARVDPFKYFSFSDVTFANNPEKVRTQVGKIATGASVKYPGEKVTAVIGYTNLTFYGTTPEVYGKEYTSFSASEGGWRINRLYAAATAQDGKITGTWLASPVKRQ